MKKVLQTCLLLIIAAVCAFTPPLRAQETITIGTGTSTTYYTPYNSLFNYSFVQQIYTADEIGVPGTITAIAFNSSDQSDNCNFDIYMKLVSRSSFSSDTDFEPITSADLVYSGTYTITTGWNNFELDAPFAYDGSSNLLIAFHEKTGAYSSKHFYYTSAAIRPQSALTLQAIVALKAKKASVPTSRFPLYKGKSLVPARLRLT